jgi:hypothetical protein
LGELVTRSHADTYVSSDACTAASGLPTEDFSPAEPDLKYYRAAVGDLVAEVRGCDRSDGRRTEGILAKRLDCEPFSDVLSCGPEGRDGAIARMCFDVRNFEPGPRTSRSVAALVRISLLAQIDSLWWGRSPAYPTDTDVLDADGLIDLDDMYRAGQLKFSYRHQPATFFARAARSAERRAMPGRSPRTAGLRMARGRPRVITWLNQLADDFAEVAPPGTPALWVTSLIRSMDHQRHLRTLGYVAPLPSAHCAGYAADVEIAWFRRYRAHRLLRGLLLDRQRADEVNVIDEGQAWHVCLRPDTSLEPRQMLEPARDG